MTKNEIRASLDSILNDLRHGDLIESVAEKYGRTHIAIRSLCVRNGISTNGKYRAKRRYRKKGMSQNEVVLWAVSESQKMPSGCVLWHGKTRDGYGIVNIKRKYRTLSRLVLEKKMGRELIDGECACHTCDVRNCIEESHLFCGTKLDNNLDCIRKGRQVVCRGEKSNFAKLSLETVIEIKKMIIYGICLKEISHMNQVSLQSVRRIGSGKTWAHVKIEEKK